MLCITTFGSLRGTGTIAVASDVRPRSGDVRLGGEVPPPVTSMAHTV